MDLSRYVDLFLAESREHLGAAHSVLSRIEREPQQPELWHEFMRRVHSLKGMAAVMQYGSIAGLTHAAEALAARLESRPDDRPERYVPLLAEGLACLGDLLDRIERGEEAHSDRADELARALGGPAPQREPAAVHAHPTPAAGGAERPEEPPGKLAAWRLELRLADSHARSARRTVERVACVRSLGRVLNSVPPRLDTETGGLREPLRLVLESALDRRELEARLRSLVGPRGFALRSEPLPESGDAPSDGPAHWVRVRSDRLDAILEQLLDLRQEHLRLSAALPPRPASARGHLDRADLRLRDLYEALVELRLVPFETLAQRLHQAVHDLAGRQGKPVRFEIVGGQALFDRAVLDALLDPLMHSLTNAIDHGIEPPSDRRRAGKPPTGSLRLTVDRRGDRIAIAVEDDGGGMDPAALRRAAVRLGVLSAEDAADLTDDEALLLATVPRLTTRSDADHVSGRGVGLDVVRECVERLGGYVAIRSERGRGCELRLSVPLHRALVRALLVRCAGDLYALPVERVVRSVDPERLSEAGEGGAPPRPVRLDERLGLTPRRDGLPSPGRALLLRMPRPRIALLVDEVVGRKDLVVQPLQGPLARVREYAGAAALDDGSIAVVLEPLVLVRRSLRRGASAAS